MRPRAAVIRFFESQTNTYAAKGRNLEILRISE